MGVAATRGSAAPQTAVVVTSCHVNSDFSLTSDVDDFPWDQAHQSCVIRKNWQGQAVDDVWRTEVRSLWTQENLYVLFVAGYETLALDASIQEDEKGDCFGIWEHDVVEMFIGNDPDIRKYYEFVVSPLGQKIDIRHDKNLPGDEGRFCEYTSFWRARVNNQPPLKRWICQFRIPWSAISAGPGAAGKRFRANFYRCTGDNDANRKHRHYLALTPTYTDKPNFHVPERFGWIVLAVGDVSPEPNALNGHRKQK